MVSRRKGLAAALALLLPLGWIAMKGPQGVPALLDKQREIRRLEDEIAATRAENTRRRERIKRLENSVSEQEMEIRKRFHLQKKGETTFMLPEGAKPENAK